MRLIIKVVMVVLLIGVVAYGAMCIYGNFFSSGANNGIDMPSEKEATHSLVVKNTATVILVSDFEIFGDVPGNRTYYLHGYWELRGRDFKYIDDTLVLSEGTFGVIDLKRR